MTSRYDYAYSVGLIRALELLLLNENEVERMILSKDANEAFKILNELSYSDNKAGIEDPADFQTVIQEGLMDIKEVLDKVSPDKRIMNIIWHRFDFHNMKTMLKAQLGDIEYAEIEPLLSPFGAIPVEALKSFIFDEKDADFGLTDHTEQYIKKRIIKTREQFHKEGDNPQVIDLYLDQKLMKVTYGIATDTKSAFLIKYLQAFIDITNIKLFFRMKSQNKSLELYEIAFLWNGSIGYKKFEDAFKEDLSSFPDIFRGTKYATIISKGLKHLEEEKTLVFLEKESENYLTRILKEAKLVAFGPEPLIAYFLAAKNNALIIRMILISKLNNIEPEEIKPRLRVLYS